MFKLEFYDEKIKQKAMQKVSGLSGVESITVDMKEKKMTVTGDIDPVKMAARLRKVCHSDIISVGPIKEPEQKKSDQPAPPKKDDSKKEEPKKMSNGGGGGGGGPAGAGGGGGGGGLEKKKLDVKSLALAPVAAPPPTLPPPRVSQVQAHQLVKAFPEEAYHYQYMPPPPPPPMPYHGQYHQYPPLPPMPSAYYVRSAEEDPNSCAIC